MHYHYKKIVILIAAIFSCNNAIAKSGLLFTPLCDEAYLKTLPRTWKANWQFPTQSDIISISYEYKNGNASVTLKLRSIANITADEQKTLTLNQTTDTPYWSYTSQTINVIDATTIDQQTQQSVGGEYTIFARRTCSPDEKAMVISAEQAAQLIKNKRILFYTGAGISAAADVDTMEKLQRGLCICNNISTAHHILNNPEPLKSYFAHFCRQAFEAASTQAHQALAMFIKNKSENTAVITENFDFLHERSGIIPYKLDNQSDANSLYNEDVSTLSLIDVLICIGLSYDDRGFIGWYKHHNPEGILIAVDLKQPSYLSNDDYLVLGDLQEKVPEMLNFTSILL